MSSKVCPSFVACVVGLSLEHGESFGRRTGTGKSCLCYRFVHPGFDDYINNHQSLYALHEFESRVINNDHFLYWGSPVKTFPTTDPVRTVELRVHVLEHSVFYQDVTCQPFTIITKPDRPDFYIKRITGAIESPGKLSYRSRDEVSTPEDYNAEQYPSGISKVSRGFLVVVDVSQKSDLFEKQLKRAEKVLEYLTKHKRKNVIVATKRDTAFTPSLEKVYELKKKYHTHVVEASAEQNLNVSECFRVLAYKLFKNSYKLSSHVQTYPDAARRNLTNKGTARRLFKSFLKKRILDPDERLSAIAQNEEYKECVELIGKYETDHLFAKHVLEVYNDKVDLFAGVKENPEMREEFLEDFVERRSDLSLYIKKLRGWIESTIKEATASTDLDDELDTGLYDAPRHTPDAPVDDYQMFQPASPSQVTQDSGFHQDGATLLSAEAEDTVKDKDSYYSDSEGSEGPDYINYDPKHPPVPAPEPSSHQGVSDDAETELYDDTAILQTSSQVTPPVPSPSLQKKHSLPPIPSPSTIPLSSSSIKKRAQALGSLMGRKSMEETTPSTGSSREPQEQPSPRPPSPLLNRVDNNRDVSSSKKREWASPPAPEPPHKPISPQRTIKNRAQLLGNLLGHSPKPTPPPPSPKPKPSHRLQLTLENGAPLNTDNRKDSSDSLGANTRESDGGQGNKSPPTVARRISSLPRQGSTPQSPASTSDDSAPNTPRSGRKASRPAPPPPARKNSPAIDHPAPKPPSSQLNEASNTEAVLTGQKTSSGKSSPAVRHKMMSPPLRNATPTDDPRQQADQKTRNISPPTSQHTVRSPPPQDEPSDKPRLQEIRKRLQERKNKEQQQKESSASPSRKAEEPRPRNPEPSVMRQNFVSVDIDEVVKERVSPPPLPPQNFSPPPIPPQDISPPPIPPQDISPPPIPPQDISPPPIPPQDILPPPVPRRNVSPPSIPPREPSKEEQDDGEAPMLPPRTEAMFIIEEEKPEPKDEVKKHKAKRKDYMNVLKEAVSEKNKNPGKRGTSRDHSIVSPTHMLKKKKGRNKSSYSETEPVSSPTPKVAPPSSRELPPVPTSSALPKSQFLVMKNRPLPAEPFAGTGESGDEDIDDGHDYEQFDFDHNRMPVVRPSIQSHQSMDSGVQQSTRGPIREQRSLDASTVRSVSKNSQPLRPSSGGRATVQRAKTFNGNDRSHPPAVAPRPPLHVPGGAWPEYVDGYVNTDVPSPASPTKSIQGRQLPLTPFEKAVQKLPSLSDSPDYDYPDLRSVFRTLPLPKRKGQIPVPPRFPSQGEPGEQDIPDADYIHMRTQFAADDSYVNAESIEQIRGQLLGPSQAEESQAATSGMQYSQDDMSVYINLPAPPNVTMSLPPRGVQHPTSSPGHTLPKTKPKTGPPVQPKKNRSAGTAAGAVEATSTSFASELQSKLRQKSDSPFSQSLDEPSPSEQDLDEDQLDYVNVSASLPASFFQARAGAAMLPQVLKNVQNTKEPVTAPTISLPPRNIRRINNE